MDKETFYNNIIDVDDGIKRFVGKRALTKTIITKEGRYGAVSKERLIKDRTGLFVPETPDDDFNLVFSLCTDGLHRPVYDLDFTKDQLQFGGNNRLYITDNGSRFEVTLIGNLIVVPSTNHCHAYCNTPVYFEEYVESLAELPGEDCNAYMKQVIRAGYGGLRPPWVKKEDIGVHEDEEMLEDEPFAQVEVEWKAIDTQGWEDDPFTAIMKKRRWKSTTPTSSRLASDV